MGVSLLSAAATSVSIFKAAPNPVLYEGCRSIPKRRIMKHDKHQHHLFMSGQKEKLMRRRDRFDLNNHISCLWKENTYLQVLHLEKDAENQVKMMAH